MLKHSNYVFSTNCNITRDDWKNYLEVPQEKIHVTFHGLNKDDLGKPSQNGIKDIKKNLKIPTDSFIIGTAFRFHEQKDPLLWIQIAAKFIEHVPNAHFLIVGEGPLKPQMISLINQLGLNDKFHFPGAILDGLCNYYAMMDVFLLTSHVEGPPNVVIEAQSFGVPVVTYAAGGAEEAVIDGETGWVVRDKTRSPESFIPPLLELYNNKELRDSVKKKAPAFIDKKFSMEQMIESVMIGYGKAKSKDMGMIEGSKKAS